jgi:hypothetical protein
LPRRSYHKAHGRCLPGWPLLSPLTEVFEEPLRAMPDEIYLALAKTPIEGPAGVEASFDFRAAFNATATRMMTAVLRNQQAASEYS